MNQERSGQSQQQGQHQGDTTTRRSRWGGVVTAVGAVALAAMAGACGSSSSQDANRTGQAISDPPGAATLTLNDSSAVTVSRSTTTRADGTFDISVAGLATPFQLRLEWSDAGGVSHRLYGVSEGNENLDVNGLTDLAFCGGATAGESDGDFRDGQDGAHGSATRARALLVKLSVVLAPLFARYDITDPRTDRDAVRVLLRDVRITRDDGTVTVTNRATGGVIFVGPIDDLASGVFTAENMPPGPGTPPATCTAFTYSAYGDCQVGGTQTRTILTSTPAGCTGGAPVTSQTCTYVPPTNACTSFTYSAYGACQPDSTQTRTVLTSSPAGCTGGAPVTTQACVYVPPVNACTSFTYSAYGACQPDNTQTRTVLTSSPAGCTGGTPVTSQACVYVPPLDGAALYTQYCSGCHGNAKKGKSVAAIQGAINANTGGMGSLSGLTAAQIAAISAAP